MWGKRGTACSESRSKRARGQIHIHELNFVPVDDPSERKALEAEIKQRYKPKYN